MIVSGLAQGLDSFAHEAAIESGGQTIAVIGTGLDQCYPKSSQRLYSQIKQEHLLVSEYSRGTLPHKHHFPMRNRLIAGIAQAVCVIEAKRKEWLFDYCTVGFRKWEGCICRAWRSFDRSIKGVSSVDSRWSKMHADSRRYLRRIALGF